MDINFVFTNLAEFSGGLVFALLFDTAVFSPIRRRRHASQELRHLSRLLHDSYGIWQQQLRLRELLVNSLIEHQPARWQSLKLQGYNASFMAIYPDMNAHQRELLMMIRSLTEQGLYRLNVHLSEWVEENPLKRIFSSARLGKPEVKKMAANLKSMQEHLKKWLKIYDQEFVNAPHHGLVFVGEPEEQQSHFPAELKPVVDTILLWYK